MPVEFLTDEQAAGYAAFRGAPSRAELERFFFLDDAPVIGSIDALKYGRLSHVEQTYLRLGTYRPRTPP